MHPIDESRSCFFQVGKVFIFGAPIWRLEVYRKPHLPISRPRGDAGEVVTFLERKIDAIHLDLPIFLGRVDVPAAGPGGAISFLI